MNWWRRNWVDALMIALIVGVIGGFAALLLRGSPLSVANPSPPGSVNPAVSAPEPSPPAAPPVARPASPQAAVTRPPTPPSPVTPPKPPASPPAPPVASSKPTPAKPVVAKPAAKPITTKPAASATKPAPTPKPEPGSGLGGNGPSEPTVVATKPVTKPTVIAPAKPAPPAAPATSRSQFLRNYRVAVGSFSSSARANSAVSGLRARGLPAIAVPSGKVMVVVVGPYAGESAARTALQRVQSSYPDAILYRPDGSRSRAPGTPSAPTTAPNAVQPKPTVTATDEGAYLQVAAFRNTAGATPLMTRLRSSGYPAFLSSRPDGFTRVLIGPLSADALRKNRSSLQRRGYQPFTVTK